MTTTPISPSSDGTDGPPLPRLGFPFTPDPVFKHDQEDASDGTVEQSPDALLADVAEYDERDLSPWVEWRDSELIDQAACGCQHRALLDDAVVRKAIAMNIIAPFRQAMAALARPSVEQSPDALLAKVEKRLEQQRERYPLAGTVAIEQTDLRALIALARPSVEPTEANVERVAKRLASSNGYTWEALAVELRSQFEYMARAAIAALHGER